MTDTLPSAPYNSAGKLWVLIITCLFQMLLVFREPIVNLFSNKEKGLTIITIVIALLLLATFPLSRGPIRNKFFKTHYDQFLSHYSFSKASKLFLIFTSAISIFGILIRAIVIQSVPFGVKIADMLPLIQKAGQTLLLGQNPYQVYHFPYAMPLTFWPGLWLPFVPAILMRIDLRWAGLFAWLLISIIMVVYSFISARRKSSSKQLLGSGIFILLMQVSINLVSFHGIGHTFYLWLWLLLLGICLLEGKYTWSAFFLGLIMASRQTAIIFVIPVFLFWCHRVGFKAAIKSGLLSLATLFFLILPFIGNSPRQFIIAPLEHYRYLASYAMSLGTVGWISNSIGFSYQIQKLWNAWILSMLSYFVIGALGVIAWWKARNPLDMMLMMATSIVFFSFFTPIPWDYEYYPAIFFLGLALLAPQAKI